MADVTLTKKLLADAGGWQAMKEARGLLDAGRVIEARYEPPCLSGRVRGGETEYRAGLTIRSRTDIENTCTCPDSRRRGVICAHSLAAGLAVLAQSAEAESSAEKHAGAAPAVAAADAGMFSTTDGEPCALHVILPPSFPAAWEKGTVMVVVESETGGGRKPLAALDAKRVWRVDEKDQRLGAWLHAVAGGKLPAMAMLARGEFIALLGMIEGHARVTFGKTTRARVESTPVRPALHIVRGEDGGLRCTAQVKGLPLIDGCAWVLDGVVFSPVAKGAPIAYLAILSSPVNIPPDGAGAFLQRELPVLAQFFDVSGDAVPANREEDERPGVRFAARFEGSLNFLTARLDAIYGERRITLDATGAALARFARDRGAEAAAVERLRAAGFAGPDGAGEFVLRGEQRTLAFFATVLPRLQREWEVEIGERFEHVTRDVERIAPRLEVRGSGEEWFELSYGLTGGSGEQFSGGEIQRLLQAGQSHIKRDGKTSVFDPALLEEFEHLLRDSDPRQERPGVYRIARRHAGALDNFAAEYAVQIGGEPRWREWATATRQLESLRPVPLGAMDAVLRDYQRQGVYWLHFLAENGFGGILADEMGLGKTLQALAFIATLKGRGPSLVVCPSSLVFNWAAEAAKWTPELRVLILDGPERANRFGEIGISDIVLTSYALLRRDAETYGAAEFSAVFLDEAQHIKNPDSQNAQAATSLRANRRFVLTGTPVENSVRDIWSLMNFLMPGYLGTRADFRERYERAIAGAPGAPEQARLTRRLRPFMLRRTKRQVAGELPEKVEQVSYCELTDAQKEVYGSLVRSTRQLVADLAGDSAKARMTMLTALLRLRQTSCDLRLLGLETKSGAAESSAKLALLDELLGEAIDGGHRVLVFSQFATMLGFLREHLQAQGIDHCHLDGKTRDRAGEVARFQGGGVPVFLISLKAGGVGLNLTAADTVIHFDPWWNPAVEAQATDRAHRIGQRKVVTSYKLIARGTVEEKILALQERKRATIAATIEDGEPLMEGLTMSDIEELLG